MVYNNNTFKLKNLLCYCNLALVFKVHIIGIWGECQNISFDLNLPHAKFHVLPIIAHDLHQFSPLNS